MDLPTMYHNSMFEFLDFEENKKVSVDELEFRIYQEDSTQVFADI